MGWSGRCPACGARGRLRRGGGGVLRAGAKFLTCAGGWERGDPGWERGDAAQGRSKMELCWLPPHPLPTPHRAPGSGSVGKRGPSQPASQPASQKPPYGEQWPKFFKGGGKKGKKGGEKCLDQWGIYAKTHMICNVSMRICIRYHHPSCHPGSGSAESYKVKFSSLRRRRRNVNFQAGARGVGGGEASPQGAGY